MRTALPIRAAAAGLLLCVAVSCASTTTPDPAPRQSGMSADEVLANTKLSQLAAFADVPWADDLKAEQNRLSSAPRPESPYGEWTLPEFVGRFTNVSNNERYTYQSKQATTKTVWLFGTSAGFGMGQRDQYTIASNLVRLAEADGIGIKVRNFSVPGMSQHNEVRGFAKHLELDGERPDLVVFYDGFNDTLYNFMFAGTHPGELLEPKDFDGDWMADYLRRSPSPQPAASQLPRIARHVAD
ncbi:MAG: SGNH/GDSL hydrolase family protein, partial [Actinomycetes bacterium]